MADLVITPANVLPSNAAKKRSGVGGEALPQGKAVYVDAADSNKLKLADANGTAAQAEVVGITLQSVANGQSVEYVELDPDFTPGATLVSGTTYILSGTPGGICPDSDAVSGWRKRVLFVATSTTKADMKLVRGGTV